MITLRKKDNLPLLIAGPCSAETETQVIETALRLKKTKKVDIFRAGIWKPRTRPGAFEGVGAIGLPWLQKVKELTSLPVAVEVAKGSHVDLCLEFGVDVLWIGARTTVNPFAVQEIADALRGVNIPVMVKNPINPDLALWIGGIERLANVGINNVAAIHRGFSFVGEMIYRNRPLWQIAIDLKTRMPDIPVICDPSHICGRRDLLQKIAQKAMDVDFDGLMIESHIAPDEAWSDAAQQITPEVYETLINSLIIRDQSLALAKRDDLYKLRREIDLIDDDLMQMLSARMHVAKKIGLFKKQNNITILQSNRWKEILGKSKLKAENLDLSPDFVEKIIKVIHDESIEVQERIMND